MKEVELISQKTNEEYIKSKYSYENFVSKFKKIHRIKKWCQIHMNLICLILFIISFILYLHSLKGCYDNEYECLTKKKIKYYYRLGVETLFSSIFFSFILIISIISKKFKLFYYSIPFIIVFIFTQGNDLQNHGTFNMIGFILFLFLFLFIILILYKLLLKIYSKKYKIAFIYILFICLSILIFSIIHSYSCKNFDKGLGNKKIINNKNEDLCFFIKPKKCDIPLLDWIISYSIFLKNCNGKSDDKNSFISMLKNFYNVNFDLKKNEFYFPNTENFTFADSLFNIFNECVMKNITTEKIDKKNDQFSIKFNKNKGKININLNYNETLVNERRKIAKLNSVKYENIFFIYIDSLSRQTFQRKLKKTSKLLNYLIMNNNQKFNLEQYEKYNFTNINSYQFLKYHSLGTNTPYNIFPMFFGSPYKHKGGREILYDLSKKGYITASSANACSRQPLNIYDKNLIIDNQFYNSDYENFGIFCDPHYYNPNNAFSHYMGVNSKYRRCLYGKDSYEYLFEFALKFLELYKNERKFFRIISNDGHEGNLKIIKYIDEPLHDFLINLLTNYFDDKSIIFIASDHGSSMNGFYELILSEDKMFEIFFPTLFILLPKNISEIEKKNLEYNVQKMITSYDIYATLINILYMNDNFNFTKNYQGQSLFTKIDGLKRSCKNYNELNGENSDYCKCYLYE